MRKGGGHAKGAQAERDIAVMLSLWLSCDNKRDLFWRSSLSGGRATVAFRKGIKLSNQVGDLTCIDPMGLRFITTFAIEIKHYADLDYKGILTSKGKLIGFWEEIGKQAEAHGKAPILICRQNRMPTHVCLSSEGMRILDLNDADTLLISWPHDLFILDAKHFVEVCKPFV